MADNPLRVGTVVAAEVAGVSVLTGILALVFNTCLYVQSFNQYCEIAVARISASSKDGVCRSVSRASEKKTNVF